MGDASYRSPRGHMYSFLFGVITTLLFYYTFVPRGAQVVTPPTSKVSLEDLALPPAPPSDGSSLTQLFPVKPMGAPVVAPPAPSIAESLLPAFFSPPSSTGTPTPSTTPSAPPPPPAAAALGPAVAGGPPRDTLFAGTLGKVNERGEVYEMDGVYGPGMSEAWLPNRRVAHLDLGLEGAHAPIFVDNWFAYHHGGAEALKWSSLTAGLSLVGEAKVHPATPKRRAPPLPTCKALDASGHLTLPPDLNVQGFKEYSSTALIQRGRDDGEFVGAMAGSEEGGPALTSPPEPPYVRALPWHRLYHNDTGDFHAALTSSPAGQAMLFASMTPHSRAKYCGVNGEGINPDFAPAVRCDGTPNPAGPSTRYPYCNRATAPVMVMSLDCAYVDSINHVNVIVWNVITLDGGGHVVTYNGHPRWELRTAEAVTEFEELACAGTSVYPDAPGHLFNEILPRLIHLDTVLPLHIPLLWPPGDLPGRLLADLQAAGLISPDRTFVQQPGKSMLYRAKRLYVYTSDYGSGHTPLILYTSQRFFAARLHSRTLAKAAAAAAAAAAAGDKPPPPLLHNGIIVLQRDPGASRAINNQGELMAALAAALPGVHIDTFIPGKPGYSYVETASIVYGARLVIGPHGANNNNIIGMREGSWFVEVGYSDRGEAMPSDYFCQARNLGLRYWLSMADSGSYGSGIVANVADLVDIAKQAYEGLLEGKEGGQPPTSGGGGGVGGKVGGGRRLLRGVEGEGKEEVVVEEMEDGGRVGEGKTLVE